MSPLLVPGGMHLTDVQAVDNPSPADIPVYLEMPFGFIDFTINGITPGGSATVQLYLPKGTTVDTYYKYGKTPDNAIPHWYEFLFDGTTGAEISENIITLHFVDGKRGDNDTTANGIIIDPSGPGIDSRIPPTAAFTADPVSGVAPLLVQFTDASTGTAPLTYAWDYNNDGITDNTTQSPLYTYNVAGVYSVNLTVTNAAGSNSLLRPNYITVTEPTHTPSITVTSPNGGETWQRGKTYPITWSYAGSPGSSVSIVLLKGGTQVLTIASSTPIGSGGSGSYSWKIPSDKPIGKDYQVRIQSTSKPTIKDTSNNYFSIVANTDSAGSITVTSPNGGETWQRGTSHTVTWDYSGSPGSAVKIMLLKGGIEVGTISASTSVGSGGHGSYTWPISSNRVDWQ